MKRPLEVLFYTLFLPTLCWAAETPSPDEKSNWVIVSDPVVPQFEQQDQKLSWPGNTAGVAVSRQGGTLYMVLTGQGIWRSADKGKSFERIDGGKIGGRWLTAEYEMGDVLSFRNDLVHVGMDNTTRRVRLSTDTRYQSSDEPVDERWVGEDPIGHGRTGNRGRIC